MITTLYSKDGKGYIREWSVEVEDGKYRTIHGMSDGTKVVSKWTICKPKNVGRSNETSPQEQAESEANSMIKKKIKESGYKMSVDNVDEGAGYFEPMLAQKFNPKKLEFPLLCQPKLDGIRCIATAEGLFTRKGKPIVSTPHIIDELKDIFKLRPDIILDGELYNHAYREDFNQITSIVRKQKPSQEDIDRAASNISYHIYDAAGYGVQQLTFASRLGKLRRVFKETGTEAWAESLELVETFVANTEQELDAQFEKNLSEGYEGQIVRTDSSAYEIGKRSKSLLKRKNFIDQEFKIARIEEGDGNASGMAARVVYLLDDGREFGSGLKYNNAQRKTILSQADIYTHGTVRYFQLTPDGIPRFPVTVDLHEGGRTD